MRILTDGLKVYGFGEKKTPLPFVNACSAFFYIENLCHDKISEATKENENVKWTTNKLRGDTNLVKFLRDAIDKAKEADGWSSFAVLGQLAEKASVNPKSYGYKKLSDLIKAVNLTLKIEILKSMCYAIALKKIFLPILRAIDLD
jgi:hypothetical protein